MIAAQAPIWRRRRAGRRMNAGGAGRIKVPAEHTPAGQRRGRPLPESHPPGSAAGSFDRSRMATCASIGGPMAERWIAEIRYRTGHSTNTLALDEARSLKAVPSCPSRRPRRRPRAWPRPRRPSMALSAALNHRTTELKVTWPHRSYACAAATSVLSAGSTNNQGTTAAAISLQVDLGEPPSHMCSTSAKEDPRRGAREAPRGKNRRPCWCC
jgi:hypothetical protein